MEIHGTVGHSDNHSAHSDSHHHHHHHYSHPAPIVVLQPQPQVFVAGTPVGVPQRRQIIVQQQPIQQRRKDAGNFSTCWRAFVILAALFYFFSTVPLPFASTYAVLKGDRKLIALSGVFFDAVSINGDAGTDVFVFDEEPVASEFSHLPTRSISPVLENGKFHAIRYDLYAGSEIYVEWEFVTDRYGPSVLFLRSAEAFKLFTNGDMQDIAYSDILHEKFHTLRGSYTLRTKSRSEYYVIFYMAEFGTSRGRADFYVTQKTLSLTNPPPIASNTRDCAADPSNSICTLPLSSNGGYSHQPEYYVVLAPPLTGEYGDMLSVTLHKSPRIWKYFSAVVWTCFFVVILGGFVQNVCDGFKQALTYIIALGTCGICVSFTRRRSYQRINTSDEESNDGGLFSSSASVPNDAPPEYTPISDATIIAEGANTGKIGKQFASTDSPTQGSPST